MSHPQRENIKQNQAFAYLRVCLRCPAGGVKLKVAQGHAVEALAGKGILERQAIVQQLVAQILAAQLNPGEEQHGHQ